MPTMVCIICFLKWLNNLPESESPLLPNLPGTPDWMPLLPSNVSGAMAGVAQSFAAAGGSRRIFVLAKR